MSRTSVFPGFSFRATIVLLVGLHLVSATLHVFFGAMNADEGFYAIAARSVMQGELPYRDFGYTQTPLLPFANGPLLALTGYGLFAQRCINGIWGALALVVVARWIARRASRLVAVAVIASFSLSPAWMHYIHLGKTYAFTGLLAVLAAWTFVVHPGGSKKQWLLGVLGVLGVGCRLPSAPFFAVLWLAGFWHDQGLNLRRIAVGAAGVLVPTLALIAPFFLLVPDQSRFWVFDFHLRSVRHHLWHSNPEAVAGLAPLWWTALVVLAVAIVAQRRFSLARETIVALAALAALAANLLPRGVYVEYAIPFLLPLAGALACELHRCAIGWPHARKVAVVGGLAAVQVALIPSLALATGRVPALTWRACLPPGVEPYSFDLPARLAHARGLVEELVPPSEPLLGPNILLAAETGRPVPRNARMGPFTMTSEFSEDEARRFNLLTYPELHAWLKDPKVSLLAFFTTARVNYAWSMPSFKLQSPEEAELWLGMLRRDFVVVQQDQDFLLVARPSALRRRPTFSRETRP